MTALASRLLALALLITLVTIMISGIVMPVRNSISAGAERIDALEAQINQFRTRRAKAATIRPVLVRDEALLIAESPTLAAARLQVMVERVARASSATLNSRSVGVGVPYEDWIEMPVRLDLTVAPADLQRLLYRLETQRPYLFVDRLDLRPNGRGEAEGGLAVRIDLHALVHVRPS